MAATAKSLIALVKRIHIVSLSWLGFVEELKPLIPYPDEDRLTFAYNIWFFSYNLILTRFFPAEDTVTDYNLHASRSSLFGNLHVLLTNELHVYHFLFSYYI